MILSRKIRSIFNNKENDFWLKINKFVIGHKIKRLLEENSYSLDKFILHDIYKTSA